MIDHDRLVADDKIQGFAVNKCGGVFLHLVLGQVRQQIRNEEYRIILFLTDVYDHRLTALFHHNAVNGQGQGDILVLFDPPVIVGVQIAEAAVLIDGILLDIEAGRIDVGTEDIDPLLERLFTDPEQDHGFVHPHAVDTVTGFQLLFFSHRTAELNISLLLC